MGNCFSKILASGLLVTWSFFNWPGVASADLLEQTITNKSTIRAFDLPRRDGPITWWTMGAAAPSPLRKGVGIATG
jgi:hypothetical protein